MGASKLTVFDLTSLSLLFLFLFSMLVFPNPKKPIAEFAIFDGDRALIAEGDATLSLLLVGVSLGDPIIAGG